MSSSATLIGNLTREPELRITNGGVPMLNFSVAVNKNKKNKQTGEWEKETSYFDCVAFNENAENVASSCVKGSRVIVMGYFQQRSWEDKDTGATRSKLELVVDEVGPSLKWATASITKTEYVDNGRSNNYVEAGNRAEPQRPAIDQNFNEEPF
jgi:single-strand DNA-binding protein